jgi:aspartyl-tRNA(Asn)/glutamyl-tRNA(Gln) amidotransferase subunit B
MNSFRSVERAIAHEIERQTEARRTGEPIVQETRLWDEDRGETRSMRSKEHAHDYRYFPEPDLPVLTVDDAWVARVRADLPELPVARRTRFEEAYGLAAGDAEVLTHRKDVADYFEEGVAAGASPRDMASWTTTEILRILRDEKLDRALVIRDWPVPPARLAELIALVAAGTVNRTTAKRLLPVLGTDPRPVHALVDAEGLAQVSDRGALEAIVASVVAAHPEQVEQLRAGRDKVIGFLVGQVMKASAGKANPKLAQDLLRAAIAAERPV